MVFMGTATTTLMSLRSLSVSTLLDQLELLTGKLIRTPPAQRRHNERAEQLFLLLHAAVDRLQRANPSTAFGKVHHEMGYKFGGDPALVASTGCQPHSSWPVRRPLL